MIQKIFLRNLCLIDRFSCRAAEELWQVETSGNKWQVETENDSNKFHLQIYNEQYINNYFFMK